MKQALLPPSWAKPRGYANGVAASGTQVFIAGQIGWDAEARFHTSDFAAQAKQALQNIVDVLAEAGGKPEHLVRLTWYVTDKREYLAALKDIGRAFRELIGDYDIAMSAVQVVALIEDEAKVEIEATAVIPDSKQKPSITHYPVHRFPEVFHGTLGTRRYVRPRQPAAARTMAGVPARQRRISAYPARFNCAAELLDRMIDERGYRRAARDLVRRRRYARRPRPTANCASA